MAISPHLVADQFSLGLVLYELAAGKRAFQRGSAAETMSAIIRDEAEPLPSALPAPFRWIVERLLLERTGRDATIPHATSIANFARCAIGYRKPCSRRPPRPRTRSLPRPSGESLSLPGCVVLRCCIGGAAHPAAPADLSAYKFTPISRSEPPSGPPPGRPTERSSLIHRMSTVSTRYSPGRRERGRCATSFRRSVPFAFWSSDGATIYYASRGDLWAVPHPAALLSCSCRRSRPRRSIPMGRRSRFSGRAKPGPV